jgi:hypothetical protein
MGPARATHRDQFAVLRAWGPASASYTRENVLDVRKPIIPKSPLVS